MSTPLDRVDLTVRIVSGDETVTTLTSNTAASVRDAVMQQISSTQWQSSDGGGLTLTFDLSHAVSDVVRYRWRKNKWHPEQGETFAYHAQKKTEIPKGRAFTPDDRRGVLLIMESPHLHEVTCDLTPVIPAAGATGYNIHSLKQKLAPIIRGLPRKWWDDGLSMTLCNPFQFPASLRLDPIDEPLRNDLFRQGIKALKNDFVDRLERYDPRLIINACTGDPIPAEKPRKPDPKWVVREMLSQWLEKGKTAYCKVAYGHPGKGDEGNSLIKKGVLEGADKPECYIIELPHPSTWRSTWDWSFDNWKGR